MLVPVHKDFKRECSDHRQSAENAILTFNDDCFRDSSLARAPLSGRFLLQRAISQSFLYGQKNMEGYEGFNYSIYFLFLSLLPCGVSRV